MERNLTATDRRNARRKQIQEQKLIRRFGHLMLHCEQMNSPADFAAVEKEAKALSAVRRTLKEIYHKESEVGETGMYDDDHETGDTLEAWKLRLERKLNRLADARGTKGVDRPDRQPADRKGDSQ